MGLFALAYRAGRYLMNPSKSEVLWLLLLLLETGSEKLDC